MKGIVKIKAIQKPLVIYAYNQNGFILLTKMPFSDFICCSRLAVCDCFSCAITKVYCIWEILVWWSDVILYMYISVD